MSGTRASYAPPRIGSFGPCKPRNKPVRTPEQEARTRMIINQAADETARHILMRAHGKDPAARVIIERMFETVPTSPSSDNRA